MAAAVILIPEMLSGPDGKTSAPDAQANADAPLKTYTIDLQQQAKPATETVIEERAPPPEETPPANDTASPLPDESPQAIPDSDATTVSAPQAQTTKPGEPPVTTTQKPAATQTVISPPIAVRPSSAPATSPTASVKSGRWAVQLISYAREETARRLAGEMSGAGHDAFVMPVRSGAATLYRVRIGPMSDRASAEVTLSALKTKWPGAVVVAHP